jgi:uncharacterized protein
MTKREGLLKQVFSIPLDSGRYLVYAPLHRLAFVANAALVNEVFEHCQRTTGLVPVEPVSTDSALPNDDLRSVLRLLQPLGLPPDEYAQTGVSYDSVILFLTNQCNLRCSYCYASAGEHSPETMPWEIAKSGIDFVVRDALSKRKPFITLGFHGGGEPSLNWGVLKRSVGYARDTAERNGLGLTISGAFNACWPDRVVQFVLDNFTDLSISFDGLPKIQNSQRPTKGGRGSHARVAKTLRALDDAGFRYGIRMTVTDDSVQHLEESVRHICESFKPHTIQVEPVFPQGRATTGGPALTDHGAFISQYMRAFRTASEHGITLFYSGARPEALTQRFCLAACRALVVTPGGGVTTCFEVYSRKHPLGDRFIVGHYNGHGGFEIDGEKVDRFLNCRSGDTPSCSACFCRWHCAGDCATKAPAAGAGAALRHADRCLVTQELTKFLILDRIEKSGGLMWFGPRQQMDQPEGQNEN